MVSFSRRLFVLLVGCSLLGSTVQPLTVVGSALDAFPSISAADLAATFGDLLIEHGAAQTIEEINIPVLQQRFSLFSDREAIWLLLDVLHQPKNRSIERLVVKQLGPFLNGTEKELHPATHIAFIAALHGYPTNAAEMNAALHTSVQPVDSDSGTESPPGVPAVELPIIPDPALVISLPLLSEDMRTALTTFANQVALVSETTQGNEQKSKRPWIIAGIIGGAVVVVSTIIGLAWWWGQRKTKRIQDAWKSLPTDLLEADGADLKKLGEGTTYVHWSSEQQQLRDSPAGPIALAWLARARKNIAARKTGEVAAAPECPAPPPNSPAAGCRRFPPKGPNALPGDLIPTTPPPAPHQPASGSPTSGDDMRAGDNMRAGDGGDSDSGESFHSAILERGDESGWKIYNSTNIPTDKKHT